MSKHAMHSCPDCGMEFGSAWAVTNHQRTCPVRQSHELRRIQENLEWKRGRIERWLHESYASAARAFAAYHNGHLEEARRLHQWVAEDFESTIAELTALSEGVAQAGSSHYPRLAKLRGDVKLHLEQAQDLRLILETLQRDYGQGA